MIERSLIEQLLLIFDTLFLHILNRTKNMLWNLNIDISINIWQNTSVTYENLRLSTLMQLKVTFLFKSCCRLEVLTRRRRSTFSWTPAK